MREITHFVGDNGVHYTASLSTKQLEDVEGYSMRTKYCSIGLVVVLGSLSLTGTAAWADPARTGSPKLEGPDAQAPKAEDKLVITRGRHVIYDDGRDDLYCRVRGGKIIGHDYAGRPIHSKTRMRCR